MVRNSAIHLTTAKMMGSPLLPGVLVIVGGIVVWRLWQRQTQLHDRTYTMRDDLVDLKCQVAELKAERKKSKKKPAKDALDEEEGADESMTEQLSSSLKKIADFDPWKLSWKKD